jgi:hypothetical protein
MAFWVGCANMTNRIKSVALIFSGIVIGCGAAATVKSTWAGPTPGKWTCYEYREAPKAEVDEDLTSLMNQVASSAPTGALQNFEGTGDNEPVFCVRD